MPSIAQQQQDIIDDFAFMDDWEDKYTYLIELGGSLTELPEDLKTSDRLVKGCQSRVWLISRSEGDRLFLEADSDAIITKGLIALLIRVFSGQKKVDIQQADIAFLKTIGLEKHLSPSRANGLHSMVQMIKAEALK